MVFGRKGMQKDAQKQNQDDAPLGHRNVLNLLDREADQKPHQRAQLAGSMVFDMVYRMLQDAKGARIEDLLGILAATGGFFCSVAAIKEIVARGTDPGENEIVMIAGNDGRTYQFGDLPNRYLLENEFALLSLAMGAAAHCGAQLTLDDASSVIEHVASTAGTHDFGAPRLPEKHMPLDTPVGIAINLFQKIGEALDTYEVPYVERPEAMGFALQRAIDMGKGALDPQMMIKIVIEYAVPPSRLAPGDLPNWAQRLPR